MSKNLSQVIAEIFEKPANGKELSNRTQGLGEELRKAVQSDDTAYGKFLGLLESFREIIPDEQQRYQAALKALSTTAKLSRQDVVKAIDEQMKDLAVVEKGFLPARSLRNELTAMENRAQQLKGEIAQLRDKITQLETEEKSIVSAKVSRERELELAEKTVKTLFTSISAEVAAFKKKLEELPAVAAAASPAVHAAPATPAAVKTAPPVAQPTPQKIPAKKATPAEKKEAKEETAIQGAALTEETPFQKKCPMCGGPYNLLELENKWQCFTCGHEGPADEPKAQSRKIDVPTAPAPAPAPAAAESKFQRKCPMCGGPFNLLELENKWQCFTCAHEEPA